MLEHEDFTLVEKKPAIKKAGIKAGIVTQKMMSFRLDEDLIEWLSRFRNKGRYINNLIRSEMEKRKALEAIRDGQRYEPDEEETRIDDLKN